jgi:hypothetical protein
LQIGWLLISAWTMPSDSQLSKATRSLGRIRRPLSLDVPAMRELALAFRPQGRHLRDRDDILANDTSTFRLFDENDAALRMHSPRCGWIRGGSITGGEGRDFAQASCADWLNEALEVFRP